MADGALPITIRPIATDALAPGGAPGTPRRVCLWAAHDLLTRPRVWAHRGRGPHAFDWLGVARHCTQAAEDACRDGAPLADLDDYAPGWYDCLAPAAAQELFGAWGLHRRPAADARPGDLLLFAMPAAHAAVLLEPEVIAHAYWGRALTRSALPGWWAARTVAAWGW